MALSRPGHFVRSLLARKTSGFPAYTPRRYPCCQASKTGPRRASPRRRRGRRRTGAASRRRAEPRSLRGRGSARRMTSAGCGAIAVSGVVNIPPIEIELPPRPRLLCCACGIASVTATSCTTPGTSIRCQMLSAKAIALRIACSRLRGDDRIEPKFWWSPATDASATTSP